MDIRRLKIAVIAVDVLLVAVATCFTGIIAFVGLIVPHLLRLLRTTLLGKPGPPGACPLAVTKKRIFCRGYVDPGDRRSSPG